jgi:hypothetical protein
MAFQHAIESDSQYAGLVEVVGKVLRTTLRAILFSDGVSEQWLPLSKIKLGEEDPKRGVVTVYLPKWLAKEKKYI